MKTRLFLLGNLVRLSRRNKKQKAFSWGTKTLTERSGKQTTTYKGNTYVRTLCFFVCVFLHRTYWQLSLLQESSYVLSIRAIRVERRPWNWAVRKDVLGFLSTFMPGTETNGNDDSGSFEFMLAAWTNLQQGRFYLVIDLCLHFAETNRKDRSACFVSRQTARTILLGYSRMPCLHCAFTNNKDDSACR